MAAARASLFAAAVLIVTMNAVSGVVLSTSSIGTVGVLQNAELGAAARRLERSSLTFAGDVLSGSPLRHIGNAMRRAAGAPTPAHGSGGHASTTRRRKYVALGDSYQAGVGSGHYFMSSGLCRRSPDAFPQRLAQRHGVDLRFPACAGAHSDLVVRQQLSELSEWTDFVTVGVGLSDAGIIDALFACSVSSEQAECDRRVSHMLNYTQEVLPSRASELFAAIRESAPKARVGVVGYPYIFSGGEDCAATGMPARQLDAFMEVSDMHAELMDSLSHKFNFRFFDAAKAFAGHSTCDDDRWINGMMLLPLQDSFHPNDRGHVALADLVEPLFADS